MPKSLKGFFSQYDTWMQRSSKDIKLSNKDVFDILAMISIMALVFMLVGWMLALLDQFYYTFFCLNAIALFTFIQYRYKKSGVEKKAQHLNLIRTAIVIESIHLMAILMLFQSIALWIYFRSHVSILFIIFITVISISSTLLTYIVRKHRLHRSIHVFNVSLWLLVLYVLWAHIFNLTSSAISNALVTSIVLILFAYKSSMELRTKNVSGHSVSLSLIFILMLCMLGIFVASRFNVDNPELITVDMTRAFALLFVTCCMHIKLSLPQFKRGVSSW